MEENQKTLIKLHNITIALNAVSVIAIFLLSVDFMFGIIPLIVITIINNFLAEKRKELGGSLPDDKKKQIFRLQFIAFVVSLVIVLPLLLFPFPPDITGMIIISMIAGFILIMFAVSFFEHKRAESMAKKS